MLCNENYPRTQLSLLVEVSSNAAISTYISVYADAAQMHELVRFLPQ